MRYSSRLIKLRTLAFSLALVATSIYTASSALPASSAPAAPAVVSPVQALTDEYATTLASDCVTPQKYFYLGDTVCVEAGSLPLAPSSSFRYRRFQWVAPDGSVADQTTIKIDPQQDKFFIPTTGAFSQVGTWTVKTISNDSEGYAVARFIVRNPRLRLVDLSLDKFGPARVLPGDTVQYTVSITNSGPDFAPEIQFLDAVPTNMVFVALKQSTAAFDCATPLRGETGRIVCQAKGLEEGEKVQLILYFQVSREVREGTACTSTAQITSSLEELNKADNIVQMESTVYYEPTPIEPEPEP